MDTIIAFFNSNFFVGLVAASAIILYFWQKHDNKRDIARAILQEIRWAENIINDYKETRNYKFTKKIVPTNTWSKNMHLFVTNLSLDQRDKISNLYSMGEYLDLIINKVSDTKFNQYAAAFFKYLENPSAYTQQAEAEPTPPPPWQFLLDEISLRYEPIYHSTIVENLKKIAKRKLITIKKTQE